MVLCENCLRIAPTKHVAFHQNIGAVLMRFTKTVEGNFCKRCISRFFWSLTGTTLLLGWWGAISLIVTPFIIIGNLIGFLGAIGLPDE